MSQKQARECFEILKPEGQSFESYYQQEIADCKKQLAQALKNAPKDAHGKPVFYVVARHVAKSGLSRVLSVYYFDKNAGTMFHLNYVAAILLELPMDRKYDGVKLRGCGMDMGFDLVYRLALAATGDGYSIAHQWL
jgi:hypothetical protein